MKLVLPPRISPSRFEAGLMPMSRVEVTDDELDDIIRFLTR